MTAENNWRIHLSQRYFIITNTMRLIYEQSCLPSSHASHVCYTAPLDEATAIVSRDMGVTPSTENVPQMRNILQHLPIPRNNKATSQTTDAAIRPYVFIVYMKRSESEPFAHRRVSINQKRSTTIGRSQTFSLYHITSVLLLCIFFRQINGWMDGWSGSQKKLIIVVCLRAAFIGLDRSRLSIQSDEKERVRQI